MLAILSVGVGALDAEVAAQRVSDQACARRPLTEELNATAVAAEHEAQTHPPEHPGDPRTALRACCSLIQIWAGHRLHIEMYRLVFASHQSTSRACHRLPTPHRQKHPITKHDSGAIAMMGA